MSNAIPSTASLLETLRHCTSAGFLLLDGHLSRLRASAAALGGGRVVPELDALRQTLEEHARDWPADEASRVRLLLSPDGELRVERTALPGGLRHPELGLSSAAPLLVRLDTEAVDRADPTLLHKSTARGVYDAARARMGVGGAGCAFFDVLLHNAEGELTESSICNVAVETANGSWRTPPVACGLLAGVMREALLARGLLHEGVVTLRELAAAIRAGRRLCAFNSVRGQFLIALHEQDVPRLDALAAAAAAAGADAATVEEVEAEALPRQLEPAALLDPAKVLALVPALDPELVALVDAMRPDYTPPPRGAARPEVAEMAGVAVAGAVAGAEPEAEVEAKKAEAEAEAEVEAKEAEAEAKAEAEAEAEVGALPLCRVLVEALPPALFAAARDAVVRCAAGPAPPAPAAAAAPATLGSAPPLAGPPRVDWRHPRPAGTWTPRTRWPKVARPRRRRRRRTRSLPSAARTGCLCSRPRTSTGPAEAAWAR